MSVPIWLLGHAFRQRIMELFGGPHNSGGLVYIVYRHAPGYQQWYQYW
jgi:hypothetical protein